MAEPDPNFPDRPTHSDFEVLRSAMVEHETAMRSQHESFNAAFDVAFGVVDAYSALYMAKNRVMRMMQEQGVPRQYYNEMASLWYEAFLIGARFEKLKSGEKPGDAMKS